MKLSLAPTWLVFACENNNLTTGSSYNFARLSLAALLAQIITEPRSKKEESPEVMNITFSK